MNEKITMIKDDKEVDAEIIQYVDVEDRHFILYKFDNEEDVYASLIVEKDDEIELHDVSEEDMIKINDALDEIALEEVE